MEQLGAYQIRKPLAHGGMGEVFLAEKHGPEGFVKPVVLKCVLTELARDPTFVELFLDEARLAALLTHANIAQIYDFGLVEGTYHIAMEYVPGYTLEEIRLKLRSIHAFLPLEHLACLASQICQGLHYAHSMQDALGRPLGLVHRDISPHNVMVSVDGTAKILDFGLAEARAGLSKIRTQGAVGRAGYRSPEQGRGDKVDARADVYSLGVCLWELMTNERFQGEQGLSENFVRRADQFRGGLPRQLIEILETALAPDPQDRFSDCQAMHVAFERFQAGLTHYAGQAALAAYIKDLAEGLIEHPRGHITGELVESANEDQRKGPRSELSGPQNFEEVFGVNLESANRKTLREVPDSWSLQSESKTLVSADLDQGRATTVATTVGSTSQREHVDVKTASLFALVVVISVIVGVLLARIFVL